MFPAGLLAPFAPPPPSARFAFTVGAPLWHVRWSECTSNGCSSAVFLYALSSSTCSASSVYVHAATNGARCRVFTYQSERREREEDGSFSRSAKRFPNKRGKGAWPGKERTLSYSNRDRRPLEDNKSMHHRSRRICQRRD